VKKNKILIVGILVGGGFMANSSASANDAERLYAVLNGGDVSPVVLTSAAHDFDDTAKNQLVARVASMFTPPPSGALLARLLFIQTPANRAGMTDIFLVNLRSPLPEARKASLQGLEKLEHPSLISLALASLHDESDGVLAVACQILTTKAKDDAVVQKALRSAYAARAGRKEFYLSNSILEASGITLIPTMRKRK